MHRKQAIAFIFFLYATSAIFLFGWTVSGIAASRPVTPSSVKGISTDASITQASTTATKPLVSAYPHLDTSLDGLIDAHEFALYNVETGKVVAQSSQMTPVPIASTTKLMTAHLTSLNTTPNEIITVSQSAASINGSLMGVRAGETMTANDLLYGMLLPSGNDAAHALAEYVGGKLLGNPNATTDQKLARFVMEMNREASRLYMTNTHYVDPAGLEDEGHSTAVDLAKIGSIDLGDPRIQPIMNTPTHTVIDQKYGIRHDLENSDRLVASYNYPGSIGGKTGFTPDAGHCLVSGATQNNQTYIAVVLNTYSTDNDASAIEAKKLLDYGFSLTKWQ